MLVLPTLLIALAPECPTMDASPASSELRDFVAFRVDNATNQTSTSLRILIVDNDEHSVSQVKHQLLTNRPDADDDIKCALHGLDGLVVAEEFQPQLVIIHLGLPRRSGACTAKLLRRRPWAKQVVIVSHSICECPDTEAPSNFDFHFYGGVEVPVLMQLYRNLAIRRSHIDRASSSGRAVMARLRKPAQHEKSSDKKFVDKK